MQQGQQPENSIFHTDDRIVFNIALHQGVNLTFSLSDDDLDHLVEQRREYKKKNSKLLPNNKLLIPGRN